MKFLEFSHKDAHYRISKGCFESATKAIKALREELEEYLERQGDFLTSLVPVSPLENCPEIAMRMHRASQLTGLGPMASVAGTMAQMACEAALRAGRTSVLVENGGDVYMDLDGSVTLGIYAGEKILKGKLAFYITPDIMPIAICSSSGTMGHSLSLGHCDLATVTAKDAALADSAATLAGNLVKSSHDLESTVNRVLSIKGIEGVFLVKDEKIGLGGKLPKLIALDTPEIQTKVTRDKSEFSSFLRVQ